VALRRLVEVAKRSVVVAEAATEQLAKGNQLEEFGLSSTYGLPVAAILDVTYVLMSPDYKAVNQKALRLSIR
jgi:hypothetical protein